MIGGEIERADGCGPFGDVIDETAAGSDTAFEAIHSFKNFDGLFIFERDKLLSGDREAIDLETRGEIQRKAANFKILIPANRGIVFADGRVVFGDIGE